MSTNTRYDKTMKFPDWLPKRTDGLCRCGCGKPAVKVWASKECARKKVEEFSIIKGDATAIRAAVFRRDAGVCAACKMNTERESQDLLRLWRTNYKASVEAAKPYKQRGFPWPGQKSWWQADHILEVVKGGGGCGIENFQTLCVPCHAAKTRRLASELPALRAARKNADATAAPLQSVEKSSGAAVASGRPCRVLYGVCSFCGSRVRKPVCEKRIAPESENCKTAVSD